MRVKLPIIPHPEVEIPLTISIFTSLVVLAASIAFYFTLQPVIPLFYSLALPSQYLVSKEWIFVFPAFSFGITIGHLIIIKLIKEYEVVLLKLVAWSSIILQILLCLAMIRIIINIT